MTKAEIPKAYEPKETEDKWYQFWMDRRYFHADDRSSRPSFSIVIPPPNVTGALHMGHALNETLQDVIARFKRMQGHNVCWLPGTDHAGIATQMVVERELAKDGLTREGLGREAFVGKIWEWKEKYGDHIVRQIKRMGASCDWERLRFTLDDGLSRAVREVFVRLHKDGLIYRDKRLVNWDVKFQTAISDLEVQNKEIKGSLWHIKYPLVDDPSNGIVVATTRPETLFGDVAVAVHPEDERYKKLIGKQVRLPLTDRSIPIIADLHSDPEKGSGAVKITPAHDFNDFEVGRRHKIEAISIFDSFAKLNENVPKEFQRLSREKARDKAVAELESQGLLVKIEDHVHAVPFGDRSQVIIEPRLTDQWYVNAEKLVKPAIAAVRKSKTKFFPKQWEKTYFNWLENIQPWCISRQLWWGHQIPAWYGPDGKIFVADSEKTAILAAREHYGEDKPLTRDEDVLDTWFSSALWPFSTFGWPDDTRALKNFYPTSVLVTGFDIIFFWVARMMMMGLHFINEVPFKHIYITPLVRDPLGQKMSKSKGNVIDPIEVMDQYGTDALRFTLAALSVQGRDLKLSDERIQGYRNFCNKIWNVARFLQMQFAEDEMLDLEEAPDAANLSMADKWIQYRFTMTVREVTAAADEYEFDVAARALYKFVWNELCDWYVEAIKPRLKLEIGNPERHASLFTLWNIFDGTLRLLHPFMPFITEELWQRLQAVARPEYDPENPSTSIMVSSWPEAPKRPPVTKDVTSFEQLREIITAIRAIRSQHQVPPGKRVVALLRTSDKVLQKTLGKHGVYIRDLAKLSRLELRLSPLTGKGLAVSVIGEIEVGVPLEGVIDLDAERARLSKEIEKARVVIVSLESKLSNEDFVARAPQDVVEQDKERLASSKAELVTLEKAVQQLH